MFLDCFLIYEWSLRIVLFWVVVVGVIVLLFVGVMVVYVYEFNLYSESYNDCFFFV